MERAANKPVDTFIEEILGDSVLDLMNRGTVSPETQEIKYKKKHIDRIIQRLEIARIAVRGDKG